MIFKSFLYIHPAFFFVSCPDSGYGGNTQSRHLFIIGVSEQSVISESVSHFADECIRQKVHRKCDQLPFEVDFILRSMLVALLVHAAGGGRVVSRVRQQRDLSHLVNIPLGA